MNKATVILILAVGLTRAQLNFEGNPLTENTEYTAEESRFSQRTARREESTTNTVNRVTERPQKLYPVTENATSTEKPDEEKNQITNEPEDSQESKENSTSGIRAEKVIDIARHFPRNAYNQEFNSIHHADLALSTFLNSKTPEESRLSLDHYLQSREMPEPRVAGNVARDQRGQLVASNQQQFMPQLQPAPQIDQQTLMHVSSPVDQHLTTQLMQQRQTMQAYHPVNQRQQFLQPSDQAYHPVNQRQQFLQPSDQAYHPVNQRQQFPQPSDQAYNPSANPQDLQSLSSMQQTYAPGIQARNDIFYPSGWHRVRRIRGKPYPYAQNRGGPGSYGPVPVPFKHKAPVEVIYTRPPGFHRGPPRIGNPPVPYEDASAWFPEADHPPPSKDVFYSQLYAQSYDPHYYNYIAKTGKIKPHLYGKLGKRHEAEGEGIWSELFKGFKKHGLKNIMTPTFLLGMTLPVVTLMLSALVQKRSLSRSDSREFSNEDEVQEYLERLQRAMECYEKKRRKRDVDADEC